MDNDILATWNKVNTKLINFVNQKVKDTDLAKDIVQDVFIKVFSKIDTLNEKDKIVSWIYQITRNEINSYFRNVNHSTKNENENVPDIEISDQSLTKEFSKCVSPMIDVLPDKYKQAITLSEIEGISQKELAATLNISYSGAKSRVQRGRKMLKSLLQECCVISSDSYGNIMKYKNKKCENDCD